MAKNRTRFGKVMALLDITLNEISEYLHIDKTTVSKWRTGSRKLTPRSPYFDPILSLIIERNNALPQRDVYKRQVLQKMYRKFYRYSPQSLSYLVPCP